MKVAILSPYATVAPHFETELELAQRHRDAGDQVDYLSCYGSLANCDFNSERAKPRCEDCVARRNAGLKRLEPTANGLPIAPGPGAESARLRFDFDSVNELMNYRIGNFDIGYAVLSSVVSLVRDPEPDLVAHQPMLKRFLQSAWSVFEFTRNYIRRNRPDRIYVFNGRFAAMRAVFRACQAMEVDCFLHERGCDASHYQLFENHLPHDIEAMEKAIRQQWKSAEGNPQRDEIGARWYHDRLERVERNWTSFVKGQERGLMPGEWSDQVRNIAIFTSSDDEFVAIGDHWKNPIYPNQVEAIEGIARDMLVASPDTKLYLRVHPSQAKVDNARKRAMVRIESPNLTVIPPEHPLDTYALMKNADQVVSFGSSVGIEAVYWGRPSVLLGPSLYHNLGGTWKPKTHAETIELLKSDLTPLEKTGALIYGFWFQTNGEPFSYYSPTGLFEGAFKGAPIGAEAETFKKTIGTRLKMETRRLFKKIIGTRQQR